jgi:general stress protein YciG
MGGNQEGAQKTKAKLLAKDPDHYKKIGAAGGAKSKGRTPWNKGKKTK